MGLPGTVQDLFLKSSSISTNTSTNTSGGTSWNPKKDPWELPLPEVLNPRLLDPSTFLLGFRCEE